MIICFAFNYQYHTVSLQMRLIYDQLPLKHLPILWVFATNKMSQKSESDRGKRCSSQTSPHPHLHHHHHTGRNHQQLSRSFKWEAIIAIWQLCSFLNGFCFKGADLAPCLALRTLWLFWRGSFVCMPSSSLLRSLSLSLAPPYPLQLWIRNKQVRCSLDWMWCVAWTTEGQGLGSVGLDARLEKKWGGGCLCVSLRHSHLAPWLARTDCWVGWLAHRQQPPTPPSPAHLPLVLLLPRSVLLMIRFGSGSTSAAWTSGWRFFILQPWYGHSTCALQQKRQAHTASASVGDGLRE